MESALLKSGVAAAHAVLRAKPEASPVKSKADAKDVAKKEEPGPSPVSHLLIEPFVSPHLRPALTCC